MRIAVASTGGLLLLLNALALGQESSPTPSPSAVQADTSQIPKDYEMLEESASPNGRFAVLSPVRNEKSDEENGPPYPSNLLVRLNRELGTDFQIDQFRHHAFYNERMGRIEMHLVSVKDQTVHIGGEEIFFKEGESIWSESSYKYTIDEFEQTAAKAGFKSVKVWTDERALFSIHYLTTEN